jgi:hypothetical protein
MRYYYESVLVGQDVGVGVGQLGDQALEPEAAQVMAHLAGRVGHAEQGVHLGAKDSVGDPVMVCTMAHRRQPGP